MIPDLAGVVLSARRIQGDDRRPGGTEGRKGGVCKLVMDPVRLRKICSQYSTLFSRGVR